MTFFVFCLFCVCFCGSCGGCKGKSGSRCYKGRSTEIVVELRNSTNHRFYPFCVEFGEFSRLRVSGAHSFMGPLSQLRLHYGGATSPWKWYWNQHSSSYVGVHEVFVSYFSVSIVVDGGAVVSLDEDLSVQNKSNIFVFRKSCGDKNLEEDSEEDRCTWLPSSDARAHYCVGLEEQRDCGRRMTDPSLPRERVVQTVLQDEWNETLSSPGNNCTNHTDCQSLLNATLGITDAYCNTTTHTCNHIRTHNNDTILYHDILQQDKIDIQLWISWIGRDSLYQPLTSADKEMAKYKFFVAGYNKQYDDILQNKFGKP